LLKKAKVVTLFMSSSLLQKSRENLDSAQMLIDDSKWNSSVHCSYYGCLQYIKQVAYKIKSQRIVDQDIKNNAASTHDYLIRTLNSDLAGKKLRDGLLLPLDINTSFRDLKATREYADYSPEVVTGETSKKAQASANLIVETLNGIYNLIL
jgi:hypothetical protein